MKAREVTHHGIEKLVVQYTENGTRRRKFFDSKTAANAWIAKQKNKAKTLGQEIAVTASDDFVREAVEASRKLEPYGADLTEAVRFYIARKDEEGASITLGELNDRYLKTKKTQGLRPLTLKELENRSAVFVNHFGRETKVATLTPDKISTWLDGLGFGRQTVNHYRRIAFGMFAYGVTFAGIRDNPVAAIQKKKVQRDLPEIFTQGQMKTMLDAAKGDPELTAWIALGAYAGLRAAEIERLDWSHIHLKTDTITLPPEVTKTGKKRNVQIRTKLKKILESIEQLGGPVARPNFSTSFKFQSFKKEMKFQWAHNGLRHSFGTYHYAAFRHAGETAIQMGHKGSPTMLLEHYDRGDITKAEALKWWGEAPPRKRAAKKATRKREASNA